MTKTIATLAIAGLASTASAEVLLEVNLSVPNQVTITATNGLSAVTTSGSDGIGIWLDGIIDGSDNDEGDVLVSGDLTSAANIPDNTPSLFALDGDAGLNVFSFTDGATADFTAGQIAFSGSAIWDVNAGFFNTFVPVGTSGDIFFPADTPDDLPAAEILGQWVVVPAPGAAGLLGVAGLAAARRRR